MVRLLYCMKDSAGMFHNIFTALTLSAFQDEECKVQNTGVTLCMDVLGILKVYICTQCYCFSASLAAHTHTLTWECNLHVYAYFVLIRRRGDVRGDVPLFSVFYAGVFFSSMCFRCFLRFLLFCRWWHETDISVMYKYVYVCISMHV